VLTAKHRPGEGLNPTAWSGVGLAILLDQLPPEAERGPEIGGIVTGDGEAGALHPSHEDDPAGERSRSRAITEIRDQPDPVERGEVIMTQLEPTKEQGLKNMNEASKAARECEQTRGY